MTVQRESSAELTSKYGFSVVAPISVTRPSSTACSTESCCALLKRWISSMKRIVRTPFPPRRSRARAITARTSSTRAETAEISSNAAPVRSATMRAIVVFPVPGGPKRIIDGGRSSSIARRSAEPGASTCCWPTRSSSVDGRSRTASGAFSAWRSRAASEKRSATREVCSRPDVAPRRGHRAPAGAASARHRQSAGERDAGGASSCATTSRENGVEAELYAREPERANLVARIKGGDGPSLAFLCHTDTVLADPAEWERDPWSGDLVDGEVWGRGALDMKDQVAANAVAFASLAREGFEPSGDLLLLATRTRRSEATTGYGLVWLVRRASGRRALRLRDQRGRGRAARPRRDARLPVRDRREDVGAVQRPRPRPKRPCVDAGHRRQRAREGGALPRGARRVRAAAGAHPRGEGLARGGAGRDAPARRGARSRRARSHPMLPALVEPLLAFTLSPTMIDASHQRNVIPALCEITVDCRLLPETTPADVEPLIRAALGNGRYDLEFDEAVGGTRSPLETPLWDALERVHGARSSRARGSRRWRARASPTATTCARRSARSRTASSRSGRWTRSSRRSSSTPRTSGSAVDDLELGVDMLRSVARLAPRGVSEHTPTRSSSSGSPATSRAAARCRRSTASTEQGLLTCPVVGVGRRPVRRTSSSDTCAEAVAAAEKTRRREGPRRPPRAADVHRRRRRGGDALRPSARRARGRDAPVFYLATPPSMFVEIAEELAARRARRRSARSSSRSRSAPTSPRRAS